MGDAASGRLRGQVLLITGAGGALGSALALAAGREGGTVVLLGRTVAKLEACYDALVAAGAPQPAIYPLDLAGASESDYRQLAEVLQQTFGRLDSLVHCAAELGALTPMAQYPGPLWDKVWGANLHGPVRLSRAVLALLGAAEKGSLVFIEDPHSSAYWGAYGLSKAALGPLIDLWADECDGVATAGAPAVFGVAPGPMRSALRARAFPGEVPTALASPSQRAGQLLELLIAPAALNGAHRRLAADETPRCA